MRDVFIVEAKRTPQVKSGADIKDYPVPHLGIGLLKNIMDVTSLPPDAIDEVILGNTGAPPKYPNIGRIVALEAGLPQTISGYCTHRNCASGMEAASQGWLKVASGRSDLIFAGGIESMSQMPLIFGKEMTELFANVMRAKSMQDKVLALKAFRPQHLAPIIAIEQGLTDPFCSINMGQTAEILAREFGITRQDQDEYANRSHHRATAATKEGKFDDEIVPLIIGKKFDRILRHDIGPREKSTVEGLGKLKPFFEKKSGTVTVANSCPITDGGSMLLLASEDAVNKYNLKPMARMVDYHFHGLEPERMGLGPAISSHHLLKKLGMTLDQMDLIEFNEAFAAQVIACKKVMADPSISKRWGINEKIGDLDDDKLNVNGGAIALGHPVGSTGSRLIVTLAHELKRRGGKYGLASLCIGGGQGGAVVIENL
ncbi:MAG: thiolase family protein [Bacteriovoracaceae bacterium]|jgi:acetyl-CoA C-acetyltransferase|nr:thiolase family protein [Bacteriovoracaceae bacterium]